MMTTILIIGGGLAVILLIVGLIISASEERSLVEERLGRYVEDDILVERGAGARRRQVADWLNVQADRYTWGQRLSRELARADIKLRSGEYFVLITGTAILGALIGWFLSGQNIPGSIPALILGGAFGLYAPRLYVRREQNKRLIKFDSQLPDMLSLMVNGLRAGYSIMQAMEAVSREMPSPIADEFRRVVQEIQLGIPTGGALDNLTRRIPSADLDLVVTAINVQREVGGNLAEILGTISHTIRERVRVKGEIRVLTSQVMMSGRFLSLLPVVLIIAMYFFNRGYMMHYFDPETRMIGIPALIIAAIMIITGYVIMNKISDIQV
jgi:tight adherence protein B